METWELFFEELIKFLWLLMKSKSTAQNTPTHKHTYTDTTKKAKSSFHFMCSFSSSFPLSSRALTSQQYAGPLRTQWPSSTGPLPHSQCGHPAHREHGAPHGLHTSSWYRREQGASHCITVAFTRADLRGLKCLRTPITPLDPSTHPPGSDAPVHPALP